MAASEQAASEQGQYKATDSNALLVQILGVLKRIDRHLEVQEGRLSILDTKVALLPLSANAGQSWRPDSHIGTSSTANTSKSSGKLGHESLSRTRTMSISRIHELKLPTAVRNASVESRGPRDSVPIVPVENKPEQELPNRLSQQSETYQSINIPATIAPGSPTKLNSSSPKFGSLLRTQTWGSSSPPPMTADSENVKESVEIEYVPAYSTFPPPQDWITTRTQGRILNVKYGTAEARILWTSYVGDSWTIPPDGRVELTFQQHLLERLDENRVTHLLHTLKDVSTSLEYRNPLDYVKRGSFRVTDYDFDPDYEESVAEYRTEVLTGKYRKHPISGSERRQEFGNVYPPKAAPWKRMIEVRGLSKKLIDEHETWTSNFRDPWTEALPIVSPICPFFTDREGDLSDKKYTGMNTLNQALLHHQRCLRRPPPCDDNLCFHITFYELIDLSHEDELDGEIWRSGRLHSDNDKTLEALFGSKSHRIRESACTIVLVCDNPSSGSYASTFWTSVYLCPNSFELYDKIPSATRDLDALGIAEDLIEFTLRMVIERWLKIATYFAWLIGHRDTLADPEAHDSLLFDDDSFSRSRRYFWAINYLAEMDISIAENIVQLERWIANWAHGTRRTEVRSLPERLYQLKDLRMRLRAHREEAIALRDGLFSASGVMESRASTRLGENVKLLTFVSIFFLPLSFCMSIWSINNTIFSLNALLIVVILVGLGTYLIVFNLNNLVGYCGRAYNRRKKELIAQMKENPGSKWSERGKRFETFQPKQERIKPSEWMLVVFVVHKLLRCLDIRWTFDWKRRPVQNVIGKGDDTVDVLPHHSVLPKTDTPATVDGPASPGNLEEKARQRVGGGIARWSKIFRKMALSPGMSTGLSADNEAQEQETH